MKKISAIIASGILAISLAACGTTSNQSDNNTADAGTTQSANEMPAPVIMSTDELDGTDVKITAERPLVITSEDPEAWTGSVTDAKIASFTAAKKTDTAEFNFGFAALSSGTTEASITNGTDTINFKITVE